MSQADLMDWVTSPGPLVLIERKVLADHDWPVCSRYAERYWLPVIGPSSLWMLRRFDVVLGHAEQVDIDLVQLAAELGLGKAKARWSPACRTVIRLMQFHLAERGEGKELAVRRTVPTLSRGQLARLPEYMQLAHHHLIEQRMAS